MTAPRKRGRPRTSVSIPAASTLGVRLTAEQRAALEAAAGGLDLSTWAREALLRAAGRGDLGAEAQAARVRAAFSPAGIDRAEVVRRETGRMPDDARHEGGPR